MYFDTHAVETDKQGRITLPKSLFRDGGIERGGTVCLFPSAEYWIACDPSRLQQILEVEYPGSTLDPDVRDDRRSFMLDVRALHIDPQGRIQFRNPPECVENERFHVIGTGLEFEIWPENLWQETYGKTGEGR